jgi:hypothetical protein
MIHALNLGMEGLTLLASWRAGIELRVYLGFLLLYDAGLYFVPAADYREAYWICRSADFALLFLICFRSGGKSAALKLWAWLCSAVYVLLFIIVWSGARGDAALHELVIIAITLNGSTLAIAACTVKVKWRIWFGCAAWTLAQAFPLPLYTLLSLVPLAIWTVCLFGMRGKESRDGVQHRLGDVNDATSQRGPGRSARTDRALAAESAIL